MKKRFKDSLKVSLKNFNINSNSWETLANNRPNWRGNITKGARIAEKHHIADAQRKRAARKDRTVNKNMTNCNHICPTCGRGFLKLGSAATSAHTRELQQHKTETVVFIACDGRLLQK